MRMSEAEYQDFINKRAISIKDVGRALGIPPSDKHALELAENMTPGHCKPLRIAVQPPPGGKPPQGKCGTKQTKCEMEYGRMLLMEFPGAVIIPWGVTLRMQNGHKYTPDFLVSGDGWMILVEVKQRGKNGFRQNSYQRAKVAFDQCRMEFCNFTYRWSEKHNGTWSEHKY